MPSRKKKERWMPFTSMVATSFDCQEELKNAVVVDEDLKASNQNPTEVVEQTCLSPSLTDTWDKSLPDPTSSTTIGALTLHQCDSSCVLTNGNTDHEIIKDRKNLVVADFDDHVFPNLSSTIGATTLQPCAIDDNIANSKQLSEDLGIEVAQIAKLKIEDDNQLKTNERRMTDYNKFQKILLVGEGDFSFSACLARAFGSAINMVATSLDSKEELLTKHFTSTPHIKELKRLGCLVLHDIDVHNMPCDEDLIDMKFDIIIFNFPHAGHFPTKCEKHYSLINKHKKLIRGFFKSSSKMLSSEDGEVHVRHRDDYPYNIWQIEKHAKKAGLELIEKVEFRQSDYPGYHNKRGGGVKSNKKFPLGNLSFTFKFSPLLSIRNS